MQVPLRLFLGKITRTFRSGIGEADQVRQPSDLPSRLLLGRLVNGGFAAADGHWHAQYAGDRSHVELHWDGERLTLHQQWYTQKAFVSVPGPRIAEVVRGALHYHQWLVHLPALLDPPLNVFVETGGDHPQNLTAFYPDGLLLTLLVPVSVRNLLTCRTLIDELGTDSRLLATVSAELQLAWSVVNHIEGRSTFRAHSPDSIDAATFDALGLPTFEKARVESRREGPRALTVRRRHYQLVMSVFLCDVALVLGRLESHGLVAVRTPVDAPIEETYPSAPEYSAVVLPAMIGSCVRQLVFFDDKRTRRVVYPGPIRGVEPAGPPADSAQLHDLQATFLTN